MSHSVRPAPPLDLPGLCPCRRGFRLTIAVRLQVNEAARSRRAVLVAPLAPPLAQVLLLCEQMAAAAEVGAFPDSIHVTSALHAPPLLRMAYPPLQPWALPAF